MSIHAHTFNVELAVEVGLNQAILLQHLYYWHQINENKKHNIIDDKVWTYNTAEGFSKIFPYLTAKQISYAFSKLEESDFITIGNHNKAGFDQTKWYSLNEKALKLFVKSNLQNVKSNGQNVKSNRQNVNAIPDSNPDNKTNNKTITGDELLLNKVIEKYPGNVGSKNPILKALKQLSTEEKKLALINLDRYSKAWAGYHHNLRNYIEGKQFLDIELNKRETKSKPKDITGTKRFSGNY